MEIIITKNEKWSADLVPRNIFIPCRYEYLEHVETKNEELVWNDCDDVGRAGWRVGGRQGRKAPLTLSSP